MSHFIRAALVLATIASAACGPSEETKRVLAAWETERARWIASETGPLPREASAQLLEATDHQRDKEALEGVKAGDADGKQLVDRLAEARRAFAAAQATPPPGLVEVRTETEARVAAATKANDVGAIARAIDEGGKRRAELRQAQLKEKRAAIDQARAALSAHGVKTLDAERRAFDAEQARAMAADEEQLRAAAHTKDGVARFQVRFGADDSVSPNDAVSLPKLVSFMNTCAQLRVRLTVEGPTPTQGKARATALRLWLMQQKAAGGVSSVEGAAHTSTSIFESSGGGLVTLRVVKPCS